MKNGGVGVQRDAVTQGQGDEVARALDADGLGHAQRLPAGPRVHEAELALDEEGGDDGAADGVHDGKQELRGVDDEHVGEQAVRVAARQLQVEVGERAHGAEAERAEKGERQVEAAVLEGCHEEAHARVESDEEDDVSVIEKGGREITSVSVDGSGAEYWGERGKRSYKRIRHVHCDRVVADIQRFCDIFHLRG